MEPKTEKWKKEKLKSEKQIYAEVSVNSLGESVESILLGTLISCAKTDEPPAMPMGTDSCVPRESCNRWVYAPTERGNFMVVVSPEITPGVQKWN